MYASIHIYVQSTRLCSFIYTLLRVIAAAVCICLTAKACFFHLLRGMCGCPNMKICRQTGNSWELFSPNNSPDARSDTCVVILERTSLLIKLALYWTGTGNTNFITDTSTLVTWRPHGPNKKMGFPWNHIKNIFAETVLTLYSDKCNQSNGSISRSTSPRGPSQATARKCFVTFCGCWSLFFFSDSFASNPFTPCYYSHQRLEQ